ncbi:MAG: diadenosine tetraphosphate hydrolase [Cycloclasticus sp. symbiont of Poecilosclerida sp. N]|nr:MAG: diadenosine tetraphosphate hydrolase [Cycloclasticus sp. symbiont of Poecilosclerida sp. N]
MRVSTRAEVSDTLKKCLFCNMTKGRVIAENDYAYVIYDGFPVTECHSLIIPKRHTDEYFGLTQDELLACDSLLRSMKARILKQDKTVEGFNIGMNSGAVAGQTIFHCHIHLIPRREGDVEDPRGGVRWVMPNKAKYWVA